MVACAIADTSTPIEARNIGLQTWSKNSTARQHHLIFL
jgi:hypothetical protein